MKANIADEAIHLILSYLQLDALLGKKLVCQQWKTIVTNVINGKKRKAFETSRELKHMVQKYFQWAKHCRDGAQVYNYECTSEDIENIAAYGWPIGKWDVSNIKDFAEVFLGCNMFNFDVSCWDVLNA